MHVVPARNDVISSEYDIILAGDYVIPRRSFLIPSQPLERRRADYIILPQDLVIPRRGLVISGQDEERRRADDIIRRRDVLRFAGNEIIL